jgi:hypothetical protein
MKWRATNKQTIKTRLKCTSFSGGHIGRPASSAFLSSLPPKKRNAAPQPLFALPLRARRRRALQAPCTLHAPSTPAGSARSCAPAPAGGGATARRAVPRAQLPCTTSPALLSRRTAEHVQDWKERVFRPEGWQAKQAASRPAAAPPPTQPRLTRRRPPLHCMCAPGWHVVVQKHQGGGGGGGGAGAARHPHRGHSPEARCKKPQLNVINYLCPVRHC